MHELEVNVTLFEYEERSEVIVSLLMVIVVRDWNEVD